MVKFLEFIKAIIPALSGSFDSIKQFVIQMAKKELIKLALAKLARGILKGAFGNWIIAFAVDHMFEEFVMPLMQKAFNYLGYEFDRKNGKIKFRRLLGS